MSTTILTATTPTTATATTLKALAMRAPHPPQSARQHTPLHRLSLQQRRRRLMPARQSLYEVTPGWMKRLALWLLLLPYRGLPGAWSGFWDTQAIHAAQANARPALRLWAARDRRQTGRTWRRIQRETRRVYGRALAQTPGGAMFLWRVQIGALLDTRLAVSKARLSIETDQYGATHYRLAPVSPLSGFDTPALAVTETQAEAQTETQAEAQTDEKETDPTC